MGGRIKIFTFEQLIEHVYIFNISCSITFCDANYYEFSSFSQFLWISSVGTLVSWLLSLEFHKAQVKVIARWLD